MIAIDDLIKEDLLDKPCICSRRLFPFINRCLNERGYRAVIVKVIESYDDEVCFGVEKRP